MLSLISTNTERCHFWAVQNYLRYSFQILIQCLFLLGSLELSKMFLNVLEACVKIWENLTSLHYRMPVPGGMMQGNTGGGGMMPGNTGGGMMPGQGMGVVMSTMGGMQSNINMTGIYNTK